MKNIIDAKTVKDWISDDKEIAFIDVREIAQHTEGHPFFQSQFHIAFLKSK